MADAVFVREGDRYTPTPLAAGAWRPYTLHGGPAAGLLAIGVEREARPELQASRLTIDLFSPVPSKPLRLTAETIRNGKRIQVVVSSIWSEEREIARATALLLQPTETSLPSSLEPVATMAPLPALEGPELALTGVEPGTHPGFHNLVHARWVSRGQRFNDPQAAAWLRLPIPMVEGEETSPLVMIAALSDFTNALSYVPVNDSSGFINADITLYLNRPAEGEWIGLAGQASAEPNGIALGSGVFFDHRGMFGRTLQAKLANQRAPGMSHPGFHRRP